jgi:subfamily B ATP-binding cassette protein MsbA
MIKNFKQSQTYINYSRILPFFKPYWFRAILAVLICIPIGSFDALIALSLKPYMDLVMVEKTVSSPWYIPFGIVAFTSFQGVLNYLATYLNTWVGGKITNDLKMQLYKKLLTLEPSYFDKRRSGDIISRFNSDAETACNGLLENLKSFVSKFFSSLSLIGVLFYNSWQLALIACTILGCAFIPLTRIRKKIKTVMDKSVAASSTIITAYNESFSGNKTITSFNLKNYQETKFQRILSDIFSLKIKLMQRTSWLSPMMHTIVSVGIGLAIGYGSYLILTKQITSGNFVSFITALILLYTPIKNIGNNYNGVQFSFLAIDRIFGILNMKPAIENPSSPISLNGITNNISFENVNFGYNPGTPVLKNFNLEVSKGETIALVGNSGGGKSTLVNLLPRFYDIKEGEIKIDDINIKNYSLESLRENMAFVFQDNFLFSGTIRENILLGKQSATQSEIETALKMAYLDDFVASLEKGLDTQIGERGILLSGGQKQRVAIARAFIKNAPIIILDEATSALDNKSESFVQKAIDNLMKDKTVFVIAHRLSTIKNANRIVVIHEGELAELGNHEELMQIPNGHYKTLYEMQFKKQEVEK